MNIEAIHWLDAVKIPVDDWNKFEDLPDAVHLIATGTVVKEDAEIVWVALQIDPNDGTCSGCIGIPKALILTRTAHLEEDNYVFFERERGGLMSAPERIWTGLKGTLGEDDWHEYLPEGGGVEYVRADLYAVLEQERNEYKWLAQQMEDLKDGLADEVERLRAADNTPTPEKLEAWGEWFDDPQNPFIGFDTTKLAHHTSTAGYVCRVFAAQLRALTKPEGDR